MRWAITPFGVGKEVGTRAIEDDWPLAEGEAFAVGEHDFRPGMVLAVDGKSLTDPPPVVERLLVPKSVVISRLTDAQLASARAIFDQTPRLEARWYSPDHPAVYADDPDALALLKAIGADPAMVMAP